MGKQAIEGASRGQVFYVDPNRVQIIGRDTDDGPEHPLYDEARATRCFSETRVRNILFYGVRVPVVIRKNGRNEQGEDVLEVVDGRGRTIDCREAARRAEERGDVAPLLKVELMKGSEDESMGIMVSLNEHRDAETPMGRARKAMRVLDRMGGSADALSAVANMFNVTTQTISNWTVLTGLAPAVQKAIDTKQISASAAAQLKDLSSTEQKAKLRELLAAGTKPTAEKARAKANGRKVAPKLTVKWSKREKDLVYNFPSKPDGHYLNTVLTADRVDSSGEKCPSILKELEDRGYDLATLVISVARKAEAESSEGDER